MRVPCRCGWNALRAGLESKGRASRSQKSKPTRAPSTPRASREAISGSSSSPRSPRAPPGRFRSRPHRDRGVQGLGARHPFQAASQVFDRAGHPVFVVREPPAGHHPAIAVGDCEEYRTPGRPERARRSSPRPGAGRRRARYDRSASARRRGASASGGYRWCGRRERPTARSKAPLLRPAGARVLRRRHRLRGTSRRPRRAPVPGASSARGLAVPPQPRDRGNRRSMEGRRRALPPQGPRARV